MKIPMELRDAQLRAYALKESSSPKELVEHLATFAGDVLSVACDVWGASALPKEYLELAEEVRQSRDVGATLVRWAQTERFSDSVRRKFFFALFEGAKKVCVGAKSREVSANAVRCLFAEVRGFVLGVANNAKSPLVEGAYREFAQIVDTNEELMEADEAAMEFWKLVHGVPKYVKKQLTY